MLQSLQDKRVPTLIVYVLSVLVPVYLLLPSVKWCSKSYLFIASAFSNLLLSWKWISTCFWFGKRVRLAVVGPVIYAWDSVPFDHCSIKWNTFVFQHDTQVKLEYSILLLLHKQKNGFTRFVRTSKKRKGDMESFQENKSGDSGLWSVCSLHLQQRQINKCCHKTHAFRMDLGSAIRLLSPRGYFNLAYILSHTILQTMFTTLTNMGSTEKNIENQVGKENG